MSLTSNQKDSVIEQYVDLLVDSMSMKDLISYVSEDLTNFCEKLTDNELKDEISLTLDDEMYDELVDNVTQQYPKQLNTFEAEDVQECVIDTNGAYAECVDRMVDTMEVSK